LVHHHASFERIAISFAKRPMATRKRRSLTGIAANCSADNRTLATIGRLSNFFRLLRSTRLSRDSPARRSRLLTLIALEIRNLNTGHVRALLRPLLSTSPEDARDGRARATKMPEDAHGRRRRLITNPEVIRPQRTVTCCGLGKSGGFSSRSVHRVHGCPLAWLSAWLSTSVDPDARTQSCMVARTTRRRGRVRVTVVGRGPTGSGQQGRRTERSRCEDARSSTWHDTRS
jgi:hypothetical protein